ncbi:rRNA-processing protein fcf2 [Psilocybe cubensis]|uniref:rRNA-processing protein fcf2 n=2 Tax=Psilocybe cubensis TaxID=181762 RepID=A0ACB8GXK6_PSICU|nr:rRNA-processing protein fcf2 [Psilocybe cubensis]KAH9480483.1 rRNA-processing protein fcf2 [Psilocybe cubensis]
MNVNAKGKEKAIEEEEEVSEESDSDISSSSSVTSDSDSDSSEDEEPITQEYLNLLFEKARKNAEDAEKRSQAISDETGKEEEVITLDDEMQIPLPKLNPGKLPAPYIQLGETRFDGPSSIRDPEVERTEKATASMSVPAPPLPPAELSKSGKPLTKKERKQIKNKTAGPDWFDLPAPSEADLPRLYREVEALRLRNQLDPKRFYKKDEGEGKGIKGLPKYFAIGTILPSKTPFGTPSGDNLTRANRKRTLVDELVDDAEAKRYAKKKFEDLQSVRGARGKNTLHAKQAARRPKW